MEHDIVEMTNSIKPYPSASDDLEVGQQPPTPRRNVTLHSAPRMEIVYEKLTYTVRVKEKKTGWTDKPILKGISGVISPARLTAVMGASGAGKTTFLNMLAGFTKGKVTITGDIKVNGETLTVERMRTISGFVHQEDVILDTMTVREALTFSAKLKLPSSMGSKEKEQRALDVASLLNLTKSLDSLVGSSMIKGISGGEKRRLSLGMEMITNPSLLFLDEPTSGLDTFTAQLVMKILSNLACRYGRTVVCTIHQPSSEIFNLFDDLIVLADGQVVFHGEGSLTVEYFASLGYHCPQFTNPADYLFMEVLYTEREDEALDFLAAPSRTEEAHARVEADRARVAGLIDAWKDCALNTQMSEAMKDTKNLEQGISLAAIQHRASWGTQMLLLANRTARNQWRNQLILKGKIGQSLVLSLIVGLIYLQVNDNLAGVQDRTGSLFFVVVQAVFGAVMGTLTVFGAEKIVFQREYGSSMYGLSSYFVSRTLVELPSHIILPLVSSSIIYWMVGYQAVASKFWWFVVIMILTDNCGAGLGLFVSCIFNDLGVALTVMPVFLLPLMVFSGFFVNSETIPPYFVWIQYISPMRYAFIALILNEFTGLTINCDPSEKCAPGYDGETVISNLGMSDDGSVGQNCGILLAMAVGLTLLAFIALWNAVRKLK